jgi:catechol 2,3-dioxygenase-like lactoylglutathione lyase family enzyme
MASAAMIPYLNRRLHQVALVVPDLEASMRAYHERLGVGPWALYTYGPTIVQAMTYRGRRQDYAMRIAFARWGEIQFELIQPLQGPSLYDEFLAANPAGGLHHIAVLVEDLATATQEMERAGWPVVQSGRGYGLSGDGGYAYFELAGSGLATFLELIELPSQRRPPEATFPADAGGDSIRSAAPSRA